MPDVVVENQVGQVSNNGALAQIDEQNFITDLRHFFITGEKSEFKAKPVPLSGVSSVFDAGLRHLEKMRLDFPLILPEDTEKPMITLTQFIDEMITSLDAENEETAELRHYLYLLENAMRQKCFAKSANLEETWEKALKDVIKSARTAKDKKENLQKTLKTLFSEKSFPAELLAFQPQVIQRIFSRIYARQAANSSAEFLRQNHDLLQRVSDILTIEYEKSEAAKSPEELAGRLATDEIKPDTFAGLMAHVGHLNPSQTRNARLQLVKDKLTQMIEELENGEMTVASDFKTAFKQYESTLKKFIGYFRARQIAMLEVENRYDAQQHDAYFEKFDLINVPVSELKMIWPAVVYLKQSKLTADHISEILRLAATEAPVKVIIEFDKVLEQGKAPHESHFYSAAANRLMRSLLQENNIFAAQLSLSNFTSLTEVFQNGLQFSGPSFWGVFVGGHKDAENRFKQVIGATSSRVNPAFALDPGKGLKWADKFSIATNEDFAGDWIRTKAGFIDENGDHITIEDCYTTVDFLSDQPEFAAHCVEINAAELTDDFIPVADFLHESTTSNKIPFVIKYDKKGHKFAVVVSQFLLNSGQKLQLNWQNLQELAGIENSHVQAQMQIEQEKLAAALAAKENELEQTYQAKLDSTVGSLADEIVGNIAAGLLGQTAAPVAVPATAPAAAPEQAVSAPKSEETPKAEIAGEADDDISFDAAYIDTPLCTSCNECIQRNSLIFIYDGNQQAIIKDAGAGPFRDIVEAAEKCPVKIIHPGKPLNPDEEGLEDLMKRAQPFN